MNSDKAADVAASINGCPCVAGDEDVSSNYPGEDKLKVTRRGVEWQHTGECLKLDNSVFAPARIHQAGEIATGDKVTETTPKRPVFEVIVPVLNVPEKSHSWIPRDLVYEAAKHDCLIRVLEDGSLRLRNDFQGNSSSDADGDRCRECGCTRFRLRDGEPECERCGATEETVQTKLTEAEA